MENYKSLVGKRIRDRRKALRLTQEALGSAIDADQSRIARWERGAHLPDPKYREKLLNALDLAEEALFGVTDSLPARSPGNKSEAIASIVTLLPALDDSQLNTVLDLIEGFASANGTIRSSQSDAG